MKTKRICVEAVFCDERALSWVPEKLKDEVRKECEKKFFICENLEDEIERLGKEIECLKKS